MTSKEIVEGMLAARGTFSLFDLPVPVQAAIIEVCKAVEDASCQTWTMCLFCEAYNLEHTETCPVPIARALLTFTDD